MPLFFLSFPPPFLLFPVFFSHLRVTSNPAKGFGRALICHIIAIDKGMPLVSTLVLRNLEEYLHQSYIAKN